MLRILISTSNNKTQYVASSRLFKADHIPTLKYASGAFCKLIYIYIYIHMCNDNIIVCVYIYIYIHYNVYIYIYIYIYILLPFAGRRAEQLRGRFMITLITNSTI